MRQGKDSYGTRKTYNHSASHGKSHIVLYFVHVIDLKSGGNGRHKAHGYSLNKNLRQSYDGVAVTAESPPERL